MPKKLSHYDRAGQATMVDVSAKAPSKREARASAFLAICEVGKALYRQQPADGPYAAAISAAERWVALAR